VQPDGRDGLYGVVHFKHRAIAILPIDAQGHTWLVGQHRFPLDAYSWELPEGGGALDDDPVRAAQRELKEETGLEAESYRHILTMHLSNSVSDEVSESFLATGLTQGHAEPEGTEELRIKRVPFAEALEMALDGRITDALSVATILRAQLLFLREPELLPSTR
jgi:8-oxo-dGTP pyrophosphatase MutT (NUDIX family)